MRRLATKHLFREGSFVSPPFILIFVILFYFDIKIEFLNVIKGGDICS